MPTLDQQAMDILRTNDRGGYTVPTARLYPYQWNWDSAFTALGFAEFDIERAWRELELLFEGQWSSGLVPHIIFRRDDPDYFPGPSVWGSATTPPTSGITQPPVVASVVRALVEQDPASLAEAKGRRLFDPILRWHRWLHAARDLDGLGVFAATHPWETGRDNSPDWDAGMANVDATGVGPYSRRDLGHVDAAMRPTQGEYDRYVRLLEFGRESGWDAAAIYRHGPFLVADPGITFILLRADRDLLWLAVRLGIADASDEIQAWIDEAERGVERLWSPSAGGYVARDLRTDSPADGLSSTAFLAWWAGIQVHEDTLRTNLERFLSSAEFGVPSFDPTHAKFDAVRYWRGPVWCVINYLIGRGLAECGHLALAERVRADTRRLIETAGFYEYFDPMTGRGAGGADFTWTAAIWLAWASPTRDAD